MIIRIRFVVTLGIPVDCFLVLIGSFLTLIARRISIRTGLSHVVNHSPGIQTNTIVRCRMSIMILHFYPHSSTRVAFPTLTSVIRCNLERFAIKDERGN